MLDVRLLSLLNLLPTSGYITSKELAERDEISDKTARTRMQTLRDEVKGHGAQIISKQRYGYKLEILDHAIYDTWLQKELSSLKEALPNSGEERFRYLLKNLLEAKDYRKLEDMSNELCVGVRTLSVELKRVEKILEQYDIMLERKPFYGIKAIGSEFSIRKCYMDHLLKTDVAFLVSTEQKELTTQIGSILLECMQNHKVYFSEASFQKIVLYLYVAHLRNALGCYAEADDEMISQHEKGSTYDLATDLLKRMNVAKITISEDAAELFFVMIYLAGRKISNDKYSVQSNLVVTDQIYHIVDLMIDAVYKTYGLDFTSNLDFRISLYNHAFTFHIRMTYGIPLKNPMLNEIRQKYPMAYAMAERATSAVKHLYTKAIPEDEIGYFAILLEMALESGKNLIEKKNLLLVCITGKASSQFLVFRFQNEFGMYIKNLRTCSIFDFDAQDLSDIDYIFTTVHISKNVSVPIYEISDFLETSDMVQVHSKLKKGNLHFLKEYYREDLFVTGIHGKDRNDVIAQMCAHISKVYPLPEGFYESILHREEMGNTDYGNLVAIPHPEDILIDKNIICVGILDKPIIWSHNPVQLVVLVSVCDSTSPTSQKFYEMTSALISDPQKVAKVIHDKNYSSFMKLFYD